MKKPLPVWSGVSPNRHLLATPRHFDLPMRGRGATSRRGKNTLSPGQCRALALSPHAFFMSPHTNFDRCPNPRLIIPRQMLPGVVEGAVTVDIRSFGVHTLPCTKENPLTASWASFTEYRGTPGA